jgi:hypothetical protein
MVTSYAKYEFVAIGFFTLEGARLGRYLTVGTTLRTYQLKSVPNQNC